MSIVEKLREALQSAEDTETNLRGMREMRDMAIRERERFEKERDALINELGQHKVMITGWRNTVEQLEKERDVLKIQNEQLAKERDQLNARHEDWIEERRSALHHYDTEISKLMDEREELRARLAQLTKLSTDSMNESPLWRANHTKTLEQRIDHLLEEDRRLRIELDDLKRVKRQTIDYNHTLMNEIERLRSMTKLATASDLSALSDSDLLDEIGRRINKRIFPEAK